MSAKQEGFSAELHLSRGRPGKKKWSHDGTILKDLGINKNQSSRWQMEAEVPDSVFRLYLKVARQEQREVTAQGLLRMAQQHRTASGHRTLNGSSMRSRQTTADECGIQTVVPIATDCYCLPSETLEVIDDLENQHRTLANLLSRFCNEEVVRTEHAQRRYVTRLLADMSESLLTLKAVLQSKTVTRSAGR